MTVEHAVITGSMTITIRLTEKVTCTGPKMPVVGDRPELVVERVFITYVIGVDGWKIQEMAASGRPTDPEVSTSTLRRGWTRADADLPPSWLAELAREHRPRG